MKKNRWHDRIIFLISIIFLIAVVVSLINSEKSKVCFDKKCILVELAVTDEEQIKGLSGRESLEDNKGMLFVMEREGIHSFWMKDMLFSLDIIWISNNGTVVDLIKDADLCNGPICLPIIPDAKAKYVLEVNSGFSEAAGLNRGDILDIKIRK